MATVDDEKQVNDQMRDYQDRIKLFENQSHIRYPTQTNNIMKMNKKEVCKHMRSCYPLLHGSVLSLIHHFLLIKRKYGTSIEKRLYSKMTIPQFIDRIATKRCIVFFNSTDDYKLRNGVRSKGQWETIGTEKEKKNNNNNHLTLSQYLSYDELQISAMCGISSFTHFINNGNRNNEGRLHSNNSSKNIKKHPIEGVYMGLIGARFEKTNVMEHSLMKITVEQNIDKYGYGQYCDHRKGVKKGMKQQNSWEKALDDERFMCKVDSANKEFGNSKNLCFNAFETYYSRDYLPTYEETKFNRDSAMKCFESQKYKKPFNDEMCQSILRRYHCITSKSLVDLEMLRRRIRVSLELFLFDSDRRAKESGNKKAFCHLIGLGSGYWAFDKERQDALIVEICKDIVNDCNFNNIYKLYFSWIDSNNQMIFEFNDEKSVFYVNTFEKKCQILCEFGQRNPAELDNEIGGNDELLLCAMYAWDGNSFVGNEYYLGSNYLSASGDPAAASCSTIPYVQNPQINGEHISGDNTGVYFFDWSTRDYLFMKVRDIDFMDNDRLWLQNSILSIPERGKKLYDKAMIRKDKQKL